MNGSLYAFSVLHVDAKSHARRSEFRTPHGTVPMPAFMPVGTFGAVKGITPDVLRSTGATMVLANSFHLAQRPGDDIVADLGGLHRFMGWEGPILTDSGGFQVFSLADSADVSDDGVTFRSHVDGSLVQLTPRRAVEIQENLGSDVAMVLDHVIALPAAEADVKGACERSLRWADQCRRAARRTDQALFAIVQGGLDPELRRLCARRLVEMDFAGYAVGGLSVGETPDEMYRVLDVTCPELPPDRPRYLMGVGRPQDLLEAVHRGIDLFDCVIPTRNGRNALAYTDSGTLRLRNAAHQRDPRPLDANCPCPACRHSRGYLRHLFMTGEMLGPMLLSAHNLTYYQRLMAEVRAAIEADSFVELYEEKMRCMVGAER